MFEPSRLDGLGRAGVFDVKVIDGDVPLGAYAGEGDVETVVADEFGQLEEQPDLVSRLHLHDGALHGQFVVDLHGRGQMAELDGIFIETEARATDFLAWATMSG